jgi:hypothetical protein
VGDGKWQDGQMRKINDVERRARLWQRQAIHPKNRVPDALTATRSVCVLHATEPATVYLSLQARIQQPTVDEIELALYEAKVVVKQMAMRRTLFAFPHELLSAALGSASFTVGLRLEQQLIKEVEKSGVAPNGASWFEAARQAVLETLADGSQWQAADLREALPQIQGKLSIAPQTAYGGTFPVAPRLLSVLGAQGHIMRGTNAGHWRTSRPRWTSTAAWLGHQPEPLEARKGYQEIVRSYLKTFGPVTQADLVWWLGMGVGPAKRALQDLEALEVPLVDGTGWVLPDDIEPVTSPEPAAALLPVLDPTVMGWKERDFYLGPHASKLFDRNGNAGTTAWWDGRAVGAWVQNPDGEVLVELLEEIPDAGQAALAQEAARLTDWLDGTVVGTVYPSPTMKEAKAKLAADSRR